MVIQHLLSMKWYNQLYEMLGLRLGLEGYGMTLYKIDNRQIDSIFILSV